MRNGIKTLTCVLLLLTGTLAHADFLPPNDLWQEDSLLRAAGGLTEAEFNAVIDEVEAHYKPIVAGFGGTLQVERLWSDSTVNAYARRDGSTWIVSMFGGLARRPELTRDGFSLILCHEMGHHLGGYPYASDWSSVEGEADYFSILSCGRQIWNDQAAINHSFRTKIEALPKKSCDTAWTNTADQDLCYRILTGAKAMSELLAAVDGVKKPDWSTPDTEVIFSTLYFHPKPQCRLDTYLSAARCKKQWDPNVIPARGMENSPAAEAAAVPQTCNQSEGFAFGFRPRCWFMPYLQ